MALRSSPRGRCLDDAGQACVILLGVLFCGLAVFGFVVDGTRLLVARRDLQHAVDAAALAGASALDEGRFRRHGELALEAVEAERAARLALRGAGGTDGAMTSVQVDDAGVEVRIERPVRLLMLDLVGGGLERVGARAFARPVLLP